MPGKSRNPKAAELEELTYLSVLENYVEQLWSNGSKSLLTSNTGKDVEVSDIQDVESRTSFVICTMCSLKRLIREEK